jgi:hypothetical protein
MTTTTTMTQQEWNICEDGADMMDALGQVGEPGSDARRPLVLAACDCARLALPHVLPGEDRPRLAIETAERWARGEDVTLEQVEAAEFFAYTADDAASWAAASASPAATSAAAATAWAAASAAYAAASAAYAAASAATAASAAAHAVTYAATAAHAAATAWAAASDAPDAAAADDDAHAYAHAYAAVLLQCADIVRRYFPDVPLSI